MPKRVRSPNFPFIDLKAAIHRAQQFYERERRNAANVLVAGKHWGYGSRSSTFRQIVAALVSFGLLQCSGSKDSRMVQLTDLALRILLGAADSTRQVAAIREAALKPEIHRRLADKYPSGLPSDENLRHELLFDWEPRFNETAVDGFIQNLKSTLDFAHLPKTDVLSEEEYGSEGSDGDKSPAIGQDISPSDKAGEGTTGAGQHAGLSRIPEPPDRGKVTGVKRDIFSLNEGEVIIQWPCPLSSDSVDDLTAWLELVKRKIARSVVAGE